MIKRVSYDEAQKLAEAGNRIMMYRVIDGETVCDVEVAEEWSEPEVVDEPATDAGENEEPEE